MPDICILTCVLDSVKEEPVDIHLDC